MEFVEPSCHRVDVARGRLEPAAGRYEKKLKDLAGLYGDAKAFNAAVRVSGERVVYEVTDQRPAAAHGDLIFGVTVMEPGRIGDEYFMTRGHIHALGNRPEIYYGEAGEGVMLLESPKGDLRILEISPKTICYVPPLWIHRSVNVGAERLVMSFYYPSDSGQDYEVIARANGMKSRIVADGTGWRAVANKRYRARDEGEVAALMGTVD